MFEVVDERQAPIVLSVKKPDHTVIDTQPLGRLISRCGDLLILPLLQDAFGVGRLVPSSGSHKKS